MHSENSIEQGVSRVNKSGMTQYTKSGHGIEFAQVDNESGRLVTVVKGSSKHYSAKSGYLAARHITNSINFTPKEGDTNDYSQIRIQLLPCGIYAVMFQYNGRWVCAVSGDPDSDYWLRFIRSKLDMYGVDITSLNPDSVFTFICTDKNCSPASQEAIYLLNEYNKSKQSKGQLMLPRIQQFSVPTDKLLMYGQQWQQSHLSELLKQYQQHAYNLITPVYSVEVKFGSFSWRVLTDAGEAQNEYESQTEFFTFYDYAVHSQNRYFQQQYLKPYNLVDAPVVKRQRRTPAVRKVQKPQKPQKSRKPQQATVQQENKEQVQTTEVTATITENQ